MKKLKLRWRKAQYDIAVGLPGGTSAAGVSYPDGTPLIDVAYFNEFGTDTIPARPALKLGARKAVKELSGQMIQAVRSVNKKSEVKKEYGIIGALAAGIVQQTITNLKSPANAPSTIAAKGSDNPLVDSGIYRQSITYQVREK